jgi:cellulose biosynthesis protein BcsQ
MLKVSVMGLKGGVGKTSVTLGLAGAATVRGLATLVVDLDPQGNATSILAADEPTLTVADVIANPTIANLEAALTACEWEVEPGEVDVLPSTPDVVEFDAYKSGAFRPRLSRAISKLDGYDLVLFDCPPSHGSLVREALASSDVAIVVTTPSFFGGQGVDRAVETIEEVRKHHNADLKFGGVIINRVRSTVEEHAYRQQEIAEVHGRAAVLSPVIPERVAIQQAESFGKPVQTVPTAGAREVRELFEKHLNSLLRKYAK